MNGIWGEVKGTLPAHGANGLSLAFSTLVHHGMDCVIQTGQVLVMVSSLVIAGLTIYRLVWKIRHHK